MVRNPAYKKMKVSHLRLRDKRPAVSREHTSGNFLIGNKVAATSETTAALSCISSMVWSPDREPE